MKKNARLIKLLLLVIALGALIVGARALNLGNRLEDARSWIQGLGPFGSIAFVAVYVAATVLALPGSVLTVAAGALFGSVLGVVLVSVGSTAGAALCFLISRFFARDAAARWLSKREKFRKLDELTEKHGEEIVAITRLVPLFPFNLLNYGFGLTKVGFWPYVFWSWLCMLPGTILYVVGADTISTAVKEGRPPWLLILVVFLTLAILTLIVRRMRAKLRNREDETEE